MMKTTRAGLVVLCLVAAAGCRLGDDCTLRDQGATRCALDGASVEECVYDDLLAPGYVWTSTTRCADAEVCIEHPFPRCDGPGNVGGPGDVATSRPPAPAPGESPAACPGGPGVTGICDVDECALGVDICDSAPDACVNLDASQTRQTYVCRCPPGFEGDGIGPDGCVEADEDDAGFDDDDAGTCYGSHTGDPGSGSAIEQRRTDTGPLNSDTTFPDVECALTGDDGAGPLALGEIDQLPGQERLDFLFEFCESGCYRDAHFMGPSDPFLGSGPWTTGRPFHVRHGFVNDSGKPLGAGFDVVIYITRWDGPNANGGLFRIGQTYAFTSDYVLQGTSEQCGPNYDTQTGPASCEWFVHDFPAGLPEGRYDLWALWEAPCSAWLDLGFTDACADPNEVTSMFSSGVNSPVESSPPSFDEMNEAQL